MEINGIITEIKAKEQKTETFAIQEIMADCSTYSQMGDKYENHLCFQFTGNKIDKIIGSGAKVGDRVIIKFQPQGRYYDKKDDSGKGFSQSLSAYGLELMVKSGLANNAINKV